MRVRHPKGKHFRAPCIACAAFRQIYVAVAQRELKRVDMRLVEPGEREAGLPKPRQQPQQRLSAILPVPEPKAAGFFWEGRAQQPGFDERQEIILRKRGRFIKAGRARKHIRPERCQHGKQRVSRHGSPHGR